MSLGTEVGLGPCHIVLDGNAAPPHGTAAQQPHYSAQFALSRSPISATAELLDSIQTTVITERPYGAW